MNKPNISVIIPAYNAGATIAETIASLQAQIIPSWEAIVIDDGSSDDTVKVIKELAAKDNRIRLIQQAKGGVSLARNTGIKHAQSDWLLFLDADDWIASQYLEKMIATIEPDLELDAIYCGWARVAPDGTLFEECTHSFSSDDLFEVLGQYCPFAIHACVVRRVIVQSVGGFDPTLQTCEEWDLWQRIARSGARFGTVDEVLAYYRMRPDSASTKATQMLLDALKVIEQGHSFDPRVPTPHPNYASGRSTSQLSEAKLQWTSWAAGLVIGNHEDARPLLAHVQEDTFPALSPQYVAYSIFCAALLSSCQTSSGWANLWHQVEHKIDDFLVALELQSQASALALRSRKRLEQLILMNWQTDLPTTIGTAYAVQLEITEPISDIVLPHTIERFYAIVCMEGSELGRIELPVINGLVASSVLTDAISAHFAWSILERFFEHNIYSKQGMAADKTEIENHHNQVGWHLFLQDIWNRPTWPVDRFYSSSWIELKKFLIQRQKVSSQPQSLSGLLTVEVSEELPDLATDLSELEVAFTVAGVPIGVITVPAKQNIITAQALRAALMQKSNFELCLICVREALIGRPLQNPSSLRDRLAKKAKLKHQNFKPDTEPDTLTSSTSPSVFLGRRSELIGTSHSRRAVLPVETLPELLEMAQVTGEPVLQISPHIKQTDRVVYAPELVYPTRGGVEETSAKFNTPGLILRLKLVIYHLYQHLSNIFSRWQTLSTTTKKAIQTNFYDRNHFETLFATRPDPWKYTSPYEQTKYEQTLSLLPDAPIQSALEIACAEGHFTVQLAPQVKQLVAADISKIALERTALRCTDFHHISFKQLDLTQDPLPGRFDLIVCSEVLYYAGGKEGLQSVANKIADALEPDGYLLMAHANLVIDEPDKPGFDWKYFAYGAKFISDTFTDVSNLKLIKEIQTPLYRIQLFQRHPKKSLPFIPQPPQLIKFDRQPTPLPAEVEASVCWQGGQSKYQDNSQAISSQPITTAHLPILMYHRVAPSGNSATSRWRITPEAFEEQLKYLRETGFYTISLEDWYQATTTRQPLPGRAVIITFDDGYLDFFQYAWPLLKKYGFSAIVFLVAERIGYSNIWDQAYQEQISLMGWQEIHQLRDEGVEFGSHSATHPHLTALPVSDVVREAARSRTILERELSSSISSFAYPFGDFDDAIQHLVGACGYTFGLSCKSGLSGFNDSLLALPRIEIMGSDGLEKFVAKLGG